MRWQSIWQRLRELLAKSKSSEMFLKASYPIFFRSLANTSYFAVIIRLEHEVGVLR